MVTCKFFTTIGEVARAITLAQSTKSRHQYRHSDYATRRTGKLDICVIFLHLPWYSFMRVQWIVKSFRMGSGPVSLRSLWELNTNPSTTGMTWKAFYDKGPLKTIFGHGPRMKVHSIHILQPHTREFSGSLRCPKSSWVVSKCHSVSLHWNLGT